MKIGFALGKKETWLAGRVKRAFGRRGEEGAALLEFAITLPLLMTVLTGAISFSLALYFLQQIGNATSSAAQCVGGQAGTVTDPCAMIAPQITAMLPGLTAAKLSYSVTVTNASGTKTYGPFNPPSSGTCTAAGSGGSASTEEAPNYPVSVTISYQYSWFPILNFSPSSNLQASETTMAE